MNKISHDSKTPAEDKQVITACAFIHKKFDGVEKLFLPKRALTKKFLPGIFELPGGHIEFGEDIVEGLKREVMEEHGMRISVGDPFSVFTYTNHIKGSHSVEVVYFAKFTDPIENIKLNKEDHSEYKWITENEIPETGSISPEELKNVKKGFSLLNGESQLFFSELL
ncbi:MAG: nucleoside triphosphatase [Parcubacteria group bacterium Gr01-1014_46]|nr:MAG: nucleoside triphosphatase [Parcubacteria group bacterium Gr01-1014_46]